MEIKGDVTLLESIRAALDIDYYYFFIWFELALMNCIISDAVRGYSNKATLARGGSRSCVNDWYYRIIL